MGSVAQAVLEFDEAVRVPWRPPLAAAPALALVATGAAVGGGRVHAARAGRLAPPPALPSQPPHPPASPTRGTRSVVRRPAAGVGVGAVRAECARCGDSGACSSRPLRLTRRARRLLAIAVAGGAVAAAAWLGAVSHEDDGLRLVGDASTVVQPGDTLWSIARSVAGDADVRGVVDEIQRLNGLEDSALVPGQVLELP